MSKLFQHKPHVDKCSKVSSWPAPFNPFAYSRTTPHFFFMVLPVLMDDPRPTRKWFRLGGITSFDEAAGPPPAWGLRVNGTMGVPMASGSRANAKHALMSGSIKARVITGHLSSHDLRYLFICACSFPLLTKGKSLEVMWMRWWICTDWCFLSFFFGRIWRIKSWRQTYGWSKWVPFLVFSWFYLHLKYDSKKSTVNIKIQQEHI